MILGCAPWKQREGEEGAADVKRKYLSGPSGNRSRKKETGWLDGKKVVVLLSTEDDIKNDMEAVETLQGIYRMRHMGRSLVGGLGRLRSGVPDLDSNKVHLKKTGR